MRSGRLQRLADALERAAGERSPDKAAADSSVAAATPVAAATQTPAP